MISVKDKRTRFLLIVAAFVLAALVLLFEQNRFIRYRGPSFLSFAELKILSVNPHPGWFLESRLKQFWRTPIISNEAYYRGTRPHRPSDRRLGRYLRLVSWNIEKSYHIQDAITAFSSPDSFRLLIDPAKAPDGSPRIQEVLGQREKLSDADVIVLQEMDIGHKRSGYVNAPAELAKKLNMNYAYGAEQLEVDPVYLGLEKIRYQDGSVDQKATDYYAADPFRYKGVFGSAVLSRYPIKKVTAFQLRSQAYDWSAGEKSKIGFLEKTRRTGSEVVFENEITREVKVGGRIYFRVDLDVPGLPENTLTIINIHLEIKCLPKGREAQMAEIFSYIKNIRHPVVVVGDFNSAPYDLSATSFGRLAERTAKNPETWLSVATSLLLSAGAVINAGRFATKVTKNLQDPTAKNVPVLSPNTVKPLFEMIEGFRFDDGRAFDFRGDPAHSLNGKEGTLANSNQRDLKGFKTTFSVKRSIAEVIGKYRLDWVFVKSFLKNPRDPQGPYRFAPHFGETLEEMNTSLKTQISDHHPSVVDLPFKEPKA